MGDTILNTTVKETNLWLTISADMKVSDQLGIAVAKGNQIRGLIRQNIIVYKEKNETEQHITGSSGQLTLAEIS